MVINPEKRAVEMIIKNPPCDILLVDGAIGHATKGDCSMLVGAYKLKQTVKINDHNHTVSWSFSDAGSGLMTALNVGTGGGSATLNTQKGVLVTSLGDRAQCHT